MKAKPCLHPFSQYHGYYQTHKDGRTYVYLWNRVTDQRRLISLARYRLSTKLGRELEKWEEADHKDDDFTNDDPRNLQVLSREGNQRKEQIRRRGYIVSEILQTCMICGATIKDVKWRKVCSVKCRHILISSRHHGV